jgi:hypothetical protein
MSIQHSADWEESIHYASRLGGMRFGSVGCTWRRYGFQYIVFTGTKGIKEIVRT